MAPRGRPALGLVRFTISVSPGVFEKCRIKYPGLAFSHVVRLMLDQHLDDASDPGESFKSAIEAIISDNDPNNPKLPFEG